MLSPLRAISASFSPLRSLNFRRYMGGQTISMIGTWMQSTAQAWVVWQLSHSPQDLGIVAMLATLPSLLLGPWAGVWADRLDRRRVLIATQAIAMALAITLALLVQSGQVTLWHVYLLATLLGCVNALDIPAGDAFIGDLSDIGQVHKSFVVYAMAVQTSRMIGPAVAGWLIATVGISSAFWLNGVSFLIVIFSLIRVQANQKRHTQSGNPLMEFWEGLRFSGHEPRIQDMLIFTGYITFFGFSNLQVFPAIATDYLHGGPESLGLLTGAFGAGALVSATLVMPLLQRIPRTGLMFSGVVGLSGVWFVVFSFSRSLPFSMVAIFFAAFGQPVVMATSKALIQRLAPQTMRARLLSLQAMITFGLQPFASLGLGYAAQFAGAPTAVRINGLLMVVGSLVLLMFRRGLRDWEAGIHTEASDQLATPELRRVVRVDSNVG